MRYGGSFLSGRKWRRCTVTDEVLRQRAALEQAAAGRTLCDLLVTTVNSWGDLPAYSDRDGGPWQTITWRQTREQAFALAAGFIALGLRPGERVALMLPNRVEHVLADFGAVHAGGVPVTFYATLAADQVGYMAADCDARIAVLDGAAELARWQPVLDSLPGLNKIIVRDAAACPAGDRYLSWPDFTALGAARLAATAAEVTSRVAGIRPSDPATLLYTSGTTGNPKGVVITHASIMYELVTATNSGNARPHVRWVSYLPLAHIAERMFTLYLATYNAGHTYFCHNAATELIASIGEVKPTAFFGVPRVWEKIQAGIQALLAAEQDERRRAAVAAAMDTGLRYVQSCQFGQRTPEELAAEFARAEEAVLRPIRSLLGLGEAEIVVSAAAPLPPEVGAFFAGLGMRILDVYGMTETTGAFTTNTLAAFKLGTVGQPVPGMEVRIADDSENLLVAHPLIGQALAFGDRRPYVVALLALDGDVAPAWAQARGIEAGSLAALADDPAVLAAAGEAVAAANARLARVQQVKKWRLLPVEWTAESEELTPTLKLKRRIVHAKYADIIDALYEG